MGFFSAVKGSGVSGLELIPGTIVGMQRRGRGVGRLRAMALEAWSYALILVGGTVAVWGVNAAARGNFLAGVPLATIGWCMITGQLITRYHRTLGIVAIELAKSLQRSTGIKVRVNLHGVLGHQCLRRVHQKHVEGLSFEEWRDSLVAAVPDRKVDHRGDHIFVSFDVSGTQLWIDDVHSKARVIFKEWTIPAGYRLRDMMGLEAEVRLRVAVVAGTLVLQIGGSKCFDGDTAAAVGGISYRIWETLGTIPLLHMESEHHLSEAFMYFDHYQLPGRTEKFDSARQREYWGDVGRYRHCHNNDYLDIESSHIERMWTTKIEQWKARETIETLDYDNCYFNSLWMVSLFGSQRESDSLSDRTDRY